jgi:hypothetical protein
MQILLQYSGARNAASGALGGRRGAGARAVRAAAGVPADRAAQCCPAQHHKGRRARGKQRSRVSRDEHDAFCRAGRQRPEAAGAGRAEHRAGQRRGCAGGTGPAGGGAPRGRKGAGLAHSAGAVSRRKSSGAALLRAGMQWRGGVLWCWVASFVASSSARGMQRAWRQPSHPGQQGARPRTMHVRERPIDTLPAAQPLHGTTSPTPSLRMIGFAKSTTEFGGQGAWRRRRAFAAVGRRGLTLASEGVGWRTAAGTSRGGPSQVCVPAASTPTRSHAGMGVCSEGQEGGILDARRHCSKAHLGHPRKLGQVRLLGHQGFELRGRRQRHVGAHSLAAAAVVDEAHLAARTKRAGAALCLRGNRTCRLCGSRAAYQGPRCMLASPINSTTCAHLVGAVALLCTSGRP